MFDLSSPHSPRFVVQLLPRDEGVTVRAAGSGGQMVETHTVLQRIDDVLRMASQPSFYEDVGRGLFRALFSGTIETAYRAAYTQATLDGVPLVLELHLAHDVLRLGRYPWELMHDGTRFIVQSGTVNLVRTLDFPEALPPYEPRGPLDVLVAAAQPDDQPALASVYDELDEALTDQMRMDALDLAALFPATWDSLMDWLLAGAPDVLHFEGYGDFTRTGRLFFEGDRGSDPVDAAALGAAFYSTRLRLIALSASADGAHGEESLLSSIAPTLIEAGIPAVIAVQRTLPEEVAARFWSAFYRALVDGDNVEHAFLLARQQLRRTTHWHAITLYRRSPVLATDTAPAAIRLDTAAPDQATVGWTVRAAMWIQSPDAPPPAPYIVYRLIGVDPPHDEIEVPLAMQPGGTGSAILHAGPMTVRLFADGCVVHNHAQHTRLFSPGAETPPLWFALTPRQPGDVLLTFELIQDDRVLATVQHPLRVVAETADGSSGEGVAVVHTHCAGGQTPIGARSFAGDQRESRESGYESGRGRELSRDAAGREVRRAPLPDAPRAVLRDESAFDEALDGVSDMLQTGVPPDNQDDPLMGTPGAGVGRPSDPAMAHFAPQPRSLHEDPTQIDVLSPLHNAAAAPPEPAWSRSASAAPIAVSPFDPLPEEIAAAMQRPRQSDRGAGRERLVMLALIALLVIVGAVVLVLFVL